MSAIDGLLSLLARFEAHGPQFHGKPAKRDKRKPTGPRGPIATKPVVRYSATDAAGRRYSLLPFTGALSPTRCGASQSQTRSLKLDIETTTDLAAALSYAGGSEASDPNLNAMIAWLARATAIDQGNSRAGRTSIAVEVQPTIRDPENPSRSRSPSKLRKVLKRLPMLRERLPGIPPALVCCLGAELIAECNFRRWPVKPEEADRIVTVALYALVEAHCCRRCNGTRIQPPNPTDKPGSTETVPCKQCAGVGWVAFDRREVAAGVGVSQRDHNARTAKPYRWMLAVLIGRLQALSWAAYYARGKGDT